MRTVTLTQVQPGMELARDLLDKEGNLLLEKGIKLTEQYIRRLQLFGLPALYVTDPLLEDLKDCFLLPEALHREAVANLSTLFRSHVSDLLMSARKRDMHFHRISGTVDQLVSVVSGRCDNLVNYNICDLGDSIINHSLNVCLLSIVNGLASNLKTSDLKELALGALLHDLGKLCVPSEILNKPGRHTAEETQEIRKHATYGYDIVRLSDIIPYAAVCTVQQHHERFNGSGYAAGLQGEEIHPFGRICAIADVFEAMTADRVYRPAIPRKEAIEKMVSSGHRNFDLRQLQVFLHNIPVYPVGLQVKLSTGEQGYVVRNYAKASLRPVIRIMSDSNGQLVCSPWEVDLSVNQYAHITEVL
jgi:HD-GYP domain-containing protein (c-di-GMP phosphodiesterase class II)